VASLVCNVTKKEDCSRLAQYTIKKFGAINMVAPFAGITGDGMMLKTDREPGSKG
jgi:3-oxoacyl-[acyl-carrier protein] reductase